MSAIARQLLNLQHKALENCSL